MRAASCVSIVAIVLSACPGSGTNDRDGSLRDGSRPRMDGGDAGGVCNRLTTFAACERNQDCNDGLVCNGTAYCDVEFGCMCETPPIDCNDGIPCTIGQCVEPSGDCVQVPDDTICDDVNECTVDVCTLSGCENTPVEDGTACNGAAGVCFGGACCEGCHDGTRCRSGDTLGVCGTTGSMCVGCDDGETCTDDACVAGACVNTPMADGTLCPMGSCGGGTCCTGCRDGRTCQPGNTLRVCGVDGEICGFCMCPTDTCDGGDCPPGEFRVVQVDAGTFHGCAVTALGRAYCWGRGGQGRLGTGLTSNGIVPTRVGTQTDWAMISAGGSHTCGIRDDGTNRTVWCWGGGASGRLGNGMTGNQVSPVQEDGLATDWVEVHAGGNFSCGRVSGNRIFCWGNDGTGQLGLCLAGTGTSSSPVLAAGPVLADGWLSIAVGQLHVCGIRSEGGGRRLYCWGQGADGRLGSGSIVDFDCPNAVGTDVDWQFVSAGVRHTCGVRTDGTLWCWGDNSNGQLGLGTTGADELAPMQEAGMDTNWAMVSVNGLHTCAVKTDGTLWTWGDGRLGQLGHASSADLNVPSQVMTDTDWASCTAGGDFTCATKTDGTLHCTGNGAEGRLGIGDSTGRNVFDRVCVGG